jgi:putative DNA primase/helicase
MSNFARAELRYGARGWPVFPCSGKRPLTAHGFQDASADAVTIEAWWRRWPTANLAVATGTTAWVLDVDVHEKPDGTVVDGFAALATLEAQHATLPATPTVRTGGGGRHHYFAPDPRVTGRRGTLPPGIDVKGVGGYVMVPPSIHPDTGQPYCWEAGFAPAGLPLVAAPDWLLALLLAPPVPGVDRLQRDGTALVIALGSRGMQLFKFACLLRRYGLGGPAIAACVRAINRHHADPPVDDDDRLERIAARAATYAPAPPSGPTIVVR